MAEFSSSQLSQLLALEGEFEESDPNGQGLDVQSLYPLDQWCIDSSNPFAGASSDTRQSLDHGSNHTNWYSDSDSDSVSCFVTDLFESRSSEQSRRFCDNNSDINPFSGVVCDVHGEEGSNVREELELGFGVELGNNDRVESSGSERARLHADGLRIAGFNSDSDSNSGDELDRDMEFESEENRENRTTGIDDLDVRLCWDRLYLEENGMFDDSLDWEEVEERANDREDLSVVVDEVDDQSVFSGFSNGEEPAGETPGYLEWEILLAVNNLERHLEYEGNSESYLAVRDGYIYTAAEYEVLFGQALENETSLKGSPPAAKSVVENLPLVELTEEELLGRNVACAICRDEILLEEKVRRLPCSHCYHGDCILPWLAIRNTCPVCRFELPTDDPDYEQRKSERAAHDLLDFEGCRTMESNERKGKIMKK